MDNSKKKTGIFAIVTILWAILILAFDICMDALSLKNGFPMSVGAGYALGANTHLDILVVYILMSLILVLGTIYFFKMVLNSKRLFSPKVEKIVFWSCLLFFCIFTVLFNLFKVLELRYFEDAYKLYFDINPLAYIIFHPIKAVLLAGFITFLCLTIKSFKRYEQANPSDITRIFTQLPKIKVEHKPSKEERIAELEREIEEMKKDKE